MKLKISRELTNGVRFLMDECVPPIIRDSRWFMYLPFKLLFGKKANLYFEFKGRAPGMSEDEYREFYANISDTYVHGDTDLSRITIEKILKGVVGNTVVDVGCGRGLLVKKLCDMGLDVSGVDVFIEAKLKQQYPKITFIEGFVENLPLADHYYDTVVCTHTLEHVLDFEKSIQELRRVAKKKLIIVIPQQRPYLYTFDPHVRFFPYAHLFSIAMGRRANSICEEVQGDLVYIESF